MIEETLWQIYQRSYFQSTRRVIPCHILTGHRAGAIISLWNSYGQNLTLAHNKRLERSAMRYLRAQGITYKTVWGGNEDMSYRELSIFVACSLQQAQHLSAHFKQLAFYYVSDRGRVSLHWSKQTKPMCFVSKHLKKRWIASHA